MITYTWQDVGDENDKILTQEEKQKIADKWNANEAAYAAKKAKEVKTEPKPYVAKRKLAYPQIGDQLDMLWHSIDENAELKQKYFAFYEAIKAVKAKYPK